jgi:superfamily II DNA or RNA helicase
MRRTLRPYQYDAARSTLDVFSRKTSAIIVLPTGTGKTVVMAMIASGWDRGNVLLLAHRIELLEQAADKFEPELGYRPVIEQATRGMDTSCLWEGGAVVVASVQTLTNQKRLDKFRGRPFDLILVDECHHAAAASYRKVINYFTSLNPACKVLGVTATPNRADKTALGLIFEEVAYRLEIAQAIEDGWLVPVRQEFVNIEGVDFSGVRTGTNEVAENDFKASDLEAKMIEEEPLQAVAAPTFDKAESRQTLVFAAGVAHAHLLADILNRRREGCAAAVDGETHPVKRKEIVESFASGKLQFLCNFGVFTEGFDVPPVSLIVMGRPTKSVGLYTQMLGRATRPLDGVVDGPPDPATRRAAIAASPKTHALVLDFVGNSEHKLISSIDVLGGNYDPEVRQLAGERLPRSGGDVKKALEKAHAAYLLLSESKKRKSLVALVNYSTQEVSPFGPDAAPSVGGVVNTRGGATDSQINFLVNLGIDRNTAAAWSKRQASTVIEKQKAARCTGKQRQLLSKFGEDPDVNFYEAEQVISEIKANGWRRRSRQENTT